MSPLLQGLVWFIPSLVILLVVSLKFFDDDNGIFFDGLQDTIRGTGGGIAILILVAVVIKIENIIFDIRPLGIDVTWWFYQVEGVEHILYLQNHLSNPIIVHLSSLFYVLGLTFFVAFIPIFFILRRDINNFELFAKALAVNYMFILPCYIFFHVTVTSSYAPEVEPLLYSHPQYLAILQLINRQSNCFPSGHISISLTITLIAMYSERLNRLAVFGIIFTLLTAFVIIYLGVHWLIDIPAGVAVGVFAYWSTSTGRMDILFDTITEKFSNGTE